MDEMDLDEDELVFVEKDAPREELVVAINLYERLRWLKEDKDEIGVRIEELKAKLRVKIEEFGPLVLGEKKKVQVITVEAGYSYPKGDIENLINELFRSEEAKEREIAQRMVDLRKPKNGYDYLDVR